jgi:hypothetical protein
MKNSIVRKNLMNEEGYTPYCGKINCSHNMPRTTFNGSQFKCSCGWVSEFPLDFIIEYKKKWNSNCTTPA